MGRGPRGPRADVAVLVVRGPKQFTRTSHRRTALRLWRLKNRERPVESCRYGAR